MCDQDQAWESFCLTGAIFGEAQVSLFVAGSLLGVVLCSTGVVLCSTGVVLCSTDFVVLE